MNIKAVITQLPIDMSAEDISIGLQDLGSSIFCIKQMTPTCPSPEGGSNSVNFPFFLIIKNPQVQEIFKLTSLCHIVIRVEA
jgi:hypothetical protein